MASLTQATWACRTGGVGCPACAARRSHTPSTSASTTTCGWSRAAAGRTRRSRCSRRWAQVLRLDGNERDHLFQFARRRCGWTGQDCGRYNRWTRESPLCSTASITCRRCSPTCSLGTPQPTPYSAQVRGRPTGATPTGTCITRPGAILDVPNWHDLAAHVVTQLHYDAGRHPDDPLLATLIGELSIANPPFRRLRTRHDVRTRHGVRRKPSGTVRLAHLVMGKPVLTYEVLARPDEPDHLVLAYVAERAAPTEERLTLLPSWNAKPSAAAATSARNAGTLLRVASTALGRLSLGRCPSRSAALAGNP